MYMQYNAMLGYMLSDWLVAVAIVILSHKETPQAIGNTP